MAVTKIWKVTKNFAAPLKYVENEEKTRNPKASSEPQMLDDVIAYAANEDKTEQKFFVSSLNCDREHARDEFLMTKQRFGKEDGIASFHAYQSFAEENISPQLAHEIGLAFAKEMWGDRFQVVIATHLNTEHVHNHIIEGKSETGLPFFIETPVNASFYISFSFANDRIGVKGGSS